MSATSDSTDPNLDGGVERRVIRHRPALLTVLIAASLDGLCGVLFAAAEHLSIGTGLYWAVSTATTVGYGDVTPHTPLGHVLAAVAMLTVIPLFAAAFSLITSGLAVAHVHSEGDRMRQRLEHVIRWHPDIPDFKEER